MKLCVRKEILVGVLIGAVILGMIAFIATGAIEKNETTDYAKTQDVKDGYKYESHEPIYIGGNDDFVVGQNGVVSGSGTESNPYIIDSWDIDAGFATGVEIRNTNVYFIIQNCYIHGHCGDYGYGVLFYNVTNGIITSVASENNRIQLTYSSSNQIIKCTSYNNPNGYGIYLYRSVDNIIMGNTICDQAEAIYLHSSSNNTLAECAIYNNWMGITFDPSGGASSNFNYITDNNISENSGYGIRFWSWEWGANYNLFYHNNFVNNGQNAHDPYTNFWNTSSEGNYWSDYIGSDTDGDGIGDTPYNISGGDNKDNFPLIHEFAWWDTEVPLISLISPANNSVVKPRTVLDFNIEEDNLWKASYSVNGGETQLFSLPYNLSTAGWSDGTYNITVYAKDRGMNENTEIFTFTIDDIQPDISLISPENNTVIKPETIIDFDINDVHLNLTTYTLNDSLPETFSSPYSINTVGWEDKSYNITVFANDIAGNEISKTFTFTIDGTQPTINIAGVINGNYYNTNITISVDIGDAHLNISENIITLDDVLFISGITVSTEGKHTLYVYGVDKAGNNASKTIVFIIDKTPPTITVILPEDGLITNQNVTLNYSFSDNVSSVENITVSGDESTYTEEGDYSIVLTATDQAGNTAQDIVTFTIDKTNPGITISGVADGTYYNTDVTPVIDVSDANLNTTSITLNNNPFTNGTTVSAENTYTLVVQANDKAGNTANKIITFVIDKTAPTITIAESSKTTSKSSFTMSWSASEEVQYYEVSTDGNTWTNISSATSYMFTLSKGGNTLYVKGTDLVGNTGTNMITVTYQEKKGKPGIIPGFETAMFLVVLGICITLLKRRQH